MRSSSFPRALRFAIPVMLALFSLSVVTTFAQEATAVPEMERITAAALLCNDADCTDFGHGLNDFTIRAVENNSGEILDSCVTVASETQACVLEVPSNAEWNLAYNKAQTPEGYTYYGIIAGDGGPHGPISYIAFVPIEDPELIQISVAVVLCTDLECEEFGDRVGNVTITAVDQFTRETLGMCTTTPGTETQTCQTEVPANADLEFLADEDMIPAGYAYFGSVITIEDDPHGPITYLPFVPEGEAPDPTVVPTAPPVKALPSTGSSTLATNGSSTWETITLATITVVLGGTALLLRRR